MLYSRCRFIQNDSSDLKCFLVFWFIVMYHTLNKRIILQMYYFNDTNKCSIWPSEQHLVGTQIHSIHML